MKRYNSYLFAALASAALLAAGCNSCGPATSGKKASREDMTLVPRESNFLVMLNVAPLRRAPVWKRVLELRDQPETKPRYDEMAKKTGVDVFTQIDSVLFAFPTDAQQSGEFGAIVRGGPFDEAKIIAYAKEEAAKSGAEVVISDYNGKKLYTDKQGATFASFHDQNTVFVGGKEWIKKMVDLAAKDAKEGDSASKNDALVALVKKTRTGDSVWVAGIVPESVRTRLSADPRLASASTMKDVYGSIDMKDGFSLVSAIDLAGPAEAKELAARVNDQLADAKKNPQVLMLGMTSFIDAIKVTAVDAAFHLDVKLTQPQVDDLIDRVQGLIKSFGGAMGGGGGAPQLAPPMGGSDTPPVPVPPPSPPTQN